MKVGIIGAGMVGSASAYAMVLRGACSDIVLVDAKRARAEAEAQDITHATPFAYPARVHAGDFADLAGAAVVVLACGVGQQPGESRLELLARNAAVFRAVIAPVRQHAPDALLLVATNPVDIMTQVATVLSGLPATRVIGTGTVLDTARFRALLGAHLGLSPKSVHAHVLGEHGDSEVLCWSAASAGGIGVAQLSAQLERPLTEAVRQQIDTGVRRAAYTIIEGKGATWYGIGAGVARLVQVMTHAERAVLTVSVADATFEPDKPPLALSLPRVLTREGVAGTLLPALEADERAQLHASAATLRQAWTSIEPVVRAG
ncbi:MAG: L-lactate dehydrogenase [Polyangiales bacterium]